MLSNTALIDRKIGEVARARRLDLGLTMTAVAERMNKTFHFSWTNTHVRRTEQAGRKLTLVEGFALADVLGLDVFQLVGLQPIDETTYPEEGR